MFKEDIRR